jgi:hypothetical protein
VDALAGHAWSFQNKVVRICQQSDPEPCFRDRSIAHNFPSQHRTLVLGNDLNYYAVVPYTYWVLHFSEPTTVSGTIGEEIDYVDAAEAPRFREPHASCDSGIIVHIISGTRV